jgi:toxin HigB-1
MILSFKDKETKALYETGDTRRFGQISRVAIRKLIQLDEAIALGDLAVPPGNHLEELKGNRVGQHSIRVNNQFRICFIWNGKDAESVEICDYH